MVRYGNEVEVINEHIGIYKRKYGKKNSQKVSQKELVKQKYNKFSIYIKKKIYSVTINYKNNQIEKY